jgi:hypothetical protein
LALAGHDRTLAGSWLGDGADVPVIFKVAANDSALGIALGLTPLDKACSFPLSNYLFFSLQFFKVSHDIHRSHYRRKWRHWQGPRKSTP